ncbi:DUF6456 domain-containing protein [Pararhizobium antarcticum]|uniref:DUF6456 domain-containing protein n=1 Tax=Pararhizobium antarcticum TaxID=1798805 RepID=A0A657LRA0_9HYPH|nr:DUF6456 domain-containing protein [Pararhizobium antarcticum]OJF95876.1 hypothetical protein AX760_18765 [Pararhizobium antarcticum]OJF99318.1 hypothetical protein AX761_11400 [Rhizobium sp. 58]
MREDGAARQRQMVRLVRLVAGGATLIRDGGDGATVLVGRAGEAGRPVARALPDAACALGLLVRSGDTLRATPQARAFLRRALLSAETQFQDQHRDIEQQNRPVEGLRQSVRVNLAESPLAAMARLKEKSGVLFLDAVALDAGLRLHADFTRGQLQPQLTMRYEPRLAGKSKGAGGVADLCDSAVAARGRVRAAVEAIGPELSGVALDICCFEKGLETVERERQWPVRSAKLMLRAALMALARHYAPPPTRARRTAWGDDGFRPDRTAAVTRRPAAGR